jgi:hypothetical protein
MTITRFLLLLLGLLALPLNVFAHRLDEYLQATLVTIEPEALRLQINLTPGVAVAEQVLALIDADRDGTVSTNEARAYCDKLKRHLIVKLDDRKVALKLAGSSFPPVTEIRAGSGIIQMEFVAKIGALSAGPHRMKLENRHMPMIGVYLFNAAQSRLKSVEIQGQTRNKSQSIGEIEFTYAKPSGSGVEK